MLEPSCSTHSKWRTLQFLQGLWRGLLPGQLLTIPYTAVQFVTLHQVRSHHLRVVVLGVVPFVIGMQPDISMRHRLHCLP